MLLQSCISFSILDIFFSTIEAFLLSFQNTGSVDFFLRSFNFLFKASTSKIPPKHGVFITGLIKQFFYFKYFKEVNEQWAQEPVTPDLRLRAEVFNETQLELNGINAFLSDNGFSDKQKQVITKLYFDFFRTSCPSQFLEGLQKNYQAAQKALTPFKVRAMLYSGANGTRSTFVIGAAKSMGFKIISEQHGGYYGYIEDFSTAMEVEYPECDQFLTWGWLKLPKHPAITQLQTHQLPSPWLSARKFYWKDLMIGGPKPYDILWFPSKMKLFTGAPQGASSIRRDVIDEFSISMIDLVTNAAKLKIKVFCKPYNPVTVYLMASTFKTMSEVGGEFFVCADRYDKGLTYELLNKCQLVLWDQPGTGFLECVSAGIPTLIL